MRPALAEVLAVLRCRTCGGKGWIVTTTGDGSHGTLEQENCPDCETGHAHPSPAEAQEALVASRLLPASWLDPERGPRWWCQRCFGRGVYSVARPEAAELFEGEMTAICHWCNVYPKTPGHTAAPPSHPALVAVASLGVDTLARAEAVVAEAWRARVVWRVAHATTLRDLMEETFDEGSFGAGVLYVAAVAWFHPVDVADALAWWREHDPTQEKAARAVADLAALGLHVVAVDDERVTLAVESV